jgi:hypothetical protein
LHEIWIRRNAITGWREKALPSNNVAADSLKDNTQDKENVRLWNIKTGKKIMIILWKITRTALIRKIWEEKCRIRNQKADGDAYPLHSMNYINYATPCGNSISVFVLRLRILQDSSLLWCDAASLGEYLPTFRRIAVPSSSGSSSLWPWRWRHYDSPKRRTLTQLHISEDLNSQQQRCTTLKSLFYRIICRTEQ